MDSTSSSGRRARSVDDSSVRSAQDSERHFRSHSRDSSSDSASQLQDPDDHIVSFSRIHLMHTRTRGRP